MSSSEEKALKYQMAVNAYAQQNYSEALVLVDSVIELMPHDPNCHLLRGHVYYVLQKYDAATIEYEKVLELTSDPDITIFATNGLESINLIATQLRDDDNLNHHEIDAVQFDSNNEVNLSDLVDVSEFDDKSNFNSDSPFDDIDKSGFDLSAFGSNHNIDSKIDSDTNPFDLTPDSTMFSNHDSTDSEANPFLSNASTSLPASNSTSELLFPAFWEDMKDSTSGNVVINTPQLVVSEPNDKDDNHYKAPTHKEDLNAFGDDVTIHISSNTEATRDINTDTLAFSVDFDATRNTETQPRLNEFSTFSIDATVDEKVVERSETSTSSFDMDDSFDFEAFESAFGSDSEASKPAVHEETEGLHKDIEPKLKNVNSVEFLEDFDAFDDLANIQAFDITSESTFGNSKSILSNTPSTESGSSTNTSSKSTKGATKTRAPDSELFSITGTQDAVPIFTQSDVSRLEPSVSIEQGILAPLENAPLESKQWFIALTVGVVSAIVVAAVSFGAANLSEKTDRSAINRTGWAMALAAGVVSFATTGIMGSLTFKQIRRTTKDLQNQFDSVRQGNLSVQATVYSEDEFGQLAAGFNEMTRVIFTTTNEATRKAQEQEEAKENLQRQVIRLLDDVEGAARGDLTVQAEVTADVLGAVADAFNLTIQNLRDIVQQVKVAAKEVTKGATNSETFARALSTDALRQAEELAVTLNSVQVMTDSIQRVAEAAREAETVARDASSIALKGGEAVENTVAGILEIRETVAETTRKVKRLAESSQEISKIVALISQIASRTNLLALNASIEAARAGEAGRGFAIVADEVRQLADKSAKSLKEIEQIVMQIQSETSSVMTAMEEGTQQVITGTKLAEEAKRSLDNIIQVANRIDILVRSITADTVDQTETSRAVATVMQSVELTAQETSQEAQRVSGALQHLVGVSRDLIASVERFRVETVESR
ncbi:methyl-accepting chemotaxis sensory transducer [Calothrix sp. NIES-4071]|nr:methyl-accepting chemotaxis sensory transducer [Calothrix sp. NIES-4071]BAZ64326.1 methyl-accepting chemotaxis sensory transducer [Calothrix sp. NIES-4105]